jgi:hypothetical protein
LQTAQDLLGGSSFVPSNKPYDWLGAGSYFWEADILRAYQWAVERRSSSPCVVGAVIELGNCLDLTTQIGVRAVKLAYVSYIDLQRRTDNPIPANRSAKRNSNDIGLRLLDRAVIDHLHTLYKLASVIDSGKTREFDTVRAMFPEGEPLYENAGFLEKTHVQIAVRKQEQVLGVFRVPAHQLAELGIPSLYDF